MNPTHHAPTDTPAAPPTMTVRVPDYAANWGRARSLPHPLVRTLEIAARCPACGGERGTPAPRRSCHDGEYFTADVWTNPCGHIDYYESVLTEAGITPRT